MVFDVVVEVEFVVVVVAANVKFSTKRKVMIYLTGILIKRKYKEKYKIQDAYLNERQGWNGIFLRK